MNTTDDCQLENARLKALVEDQKKHLIAANERLDQMRSLIENQQDKLASADVRIEEMQALADTLTQHLAETTGRLNDSASLISIHDDMTRIGRDRIALLSTRVTQLQGRVHQLKQELARYYASRSYKMTALLRFAGRIARSFRDRPLAENLKEIRRRFFGRLNRIPLLSGLTRPVASWPSRAKELAATAARLARATQCSRTVCVVVPVYRHLDDVQRCLHSLLTAERQTKFRIILVDDCSPEPAVSIYLDEIAADPRVSLLRNETNLGFVGSVNKGMIEARHSDVILLNSDTEVPPGFVDRLMAQAYAAPDIATVTPFSNNATICSWPEVGPGRELPRGLEVTEIDEACFRANPGVSIDIPTGVGSCIYIRRDALDEVGLFDQEAFGKGYGEECDFCRRAIARGWRNVLACDAFVYHAGERNFGAEAESLKRRSDELLRARYPDYIPEVATWVAREPSRDARTKVAIELASARGTILDVLHQLGGGTEKSVVDNIVADTWDRATFILQPTSTDFHMLTPAYPGLGPITQLAMALQGNDSSIIELMTKLRVEKIRVQHILGFKQSLRKFVRAVGAPFDFFVHDYMSICPKINLMSPDARYCGEPDIPSCNACLRATPRVSITDIVVWRENNSWLLSEAERVICPSEDAARRMKRYHAGRSYEVRYHEAQEPLRVPSAPAILRDPVDARKVAVLGAMAVHKGMLLLRDVADAALARKLPVMFHVIGPWSDEPPNIPFNVEIHGCYDDGDLLRLIGEVDPDLIFYPARWPETYSFTLSAGLRSGRPLLVPDIGAFPERVHGLERARRYDVTQPAESILNEIESFFVTNHVV